MKKLKLMTIVGTRPEIIKMSAIIKKADKYFDHVLVHTGQNYDYNLNEVFFKDLGLREPDHYLGVVGKNIGETMGNVISKAYDLMVEVKPDAIIVLGDTNSCLSIIAAKRLKIPIFHMEACHLRCQHVLFRARSSLHPPVRCQTRIHLRCWLPYGRSPS